MLIPAELFAHSRRRVLHLLSNRSRLEIRQASLPLVTLVNFCHFYYYFLDFDYYVVIFTTVLLPGNACNLPSPGSSLSLSLSPLSPLSLSLTHAYTPPCLYLSLSLSLSHTHTHTHTHSLSISLSLFLSLSVSLALALSLSRRWRRLSRVKSTKKENLS